MTPLLKPEAEAPLVLMKIMGGLGNQLFQYAIGRTLSLRLGVPLAFDLRDLGPRAIRRYGLDAFGVRCPVASRQDARRLRGDRTWLERILGRPQGPRPHYVRERRLWTYDPDTLPSTAPAYLDGWWQTERYFTEQEALLRTELIYRGRLSPSDQDLLEEMVEGPSVSVHVRRGDYATLQGGLAFYGAFDPEFYNSAAENVQEIEPSPTYYLFSDDPEWVRRHLKLPGPTRMVSDGRRDEAADLWLMSRCRHHIVTNSSYSWWGAWLGRHTGGITVGPRHWTVTDTPTPDVVPDWWVTVGVHRGSRLDKQALPPSRRLS